MMSPLDVVPGRSPTRDGRAISEFTVESEMDGFCQVGHFENYIYIYRLNTKRMPAKENTVSVHFKKVNSFQKECKVCLQV